MIVPLSVWVYSTWYALHDCVSSDPICTRVLVRHAKISLARGDVMRQQMQRAASANGERERKGMACGRAKDAGVLYACLGSEREQAECDEQSFLSFLRLKVGCLHDTSYV